MLHSLQTRFVSILFFGLVLAVLAIIVLVHQYRSQITHTERLGQAAAVATLLDELFADVLQASNTSRRYVLSGDADQLAAYSRSINTIPATFERIELLTQEQLEFTDALAKLRSDVNFKLLHLAEILELNERQDRASVQLHLVGGVGLQRLEQLRESLSEFRSIGYDLANAQIAQFRISVLVQVAIVILMIMCGIIWAGILSAEAIRKIFIPVASMNAQVKRIAAGDFGQTLPVARQDELGLLAEQINIMTAELRSSRDEREKAQAELAAERQNLIDAIEALNEGFASYDGDQRLLRCNQKFLDYYPVFRGIAKTGVPYETLLWEKAKSGLEPAAVGQEEAFVANRLAEFSAESTINEIELSDGRQLQRSSYRTRAGGHVTVYVDITEIKQVQASLLELNSELDSRVQKRTRDLKLANQQLQKLNAQLGAIIVSAPVAVIALTKDRKVSTWNPAAITLTGLKQEDVSDGLLNLVDDKDAKDFSTFLDSVEAGDNPPTVEMRLRHKSGRLIEANVSASVFSGGQGAILIISDLTETRVLQQQFQESQKLEVVAKLTAGLAHDFNNLLAIVLSNIELVENRVAQNDEVMGMLGSAKQASLSGVALNKKLLAFSKDKSSELKGMDLKRELASLEPLLKVTLGESISLEVNLMTDIWPVLADRSLLQSAVLNLAVNSRDSMKAGGTFRITAENVVLKREDSASDLTGDHVKLVFTDTGEGMSPETASQAFQPFFTTKDFGKGSGLGLSMVYGFAKQSGGDIQIDSVPGEGCSFTMFLSRTDVIAEDPVSRQAQDRLCSLGDGENILLVEDNAEMRRAMLLQLAELGFSPIQVENGRAALELLKEAVPIDLLLTDIVMPGDMDGRELAMQARNLRKDLPIIFVSGYSAAEDENRANASELDINILAKPFDQRELGACIKDAIQAHTAPSTSAA